MGGGNGTSVMPQSFHNVAERACPLGCHPSHRQREGIKIVGNALREVHLLSYAQLTTRHQISLALPELRATQRLTENDAMRR